MRGWIRGWGFLGLAVALGCTARSGTPTAPIGPPAVTVATPLQESLVTSFTDLTGSLAAVETVDVRPQVSGRIQDVLFRDGVEVRAGDPLIRIDPRPFQAALKKAQGDLQKAEADVRNATAQLQYNTATEARLSKLNKSGAASQEEFEQAVAQKKVAEATLASGQANVFAAQASVETAQVNLGYTTITAPIDGRIDRIYVTPGNVVTGGTGQGTILTTLVSVDPIYAYFDVDEQTVLMYRRLIREGRIPTAESNVVPIEMQLRGETGYPHIGRLDFVGNRLNPGTGTLQIRATFWNPTQQEAGLAALIGPGADHGRSDARRGNQVRLMIPGMFVRARIPGVTYPNALLIPDEAIATLDNRKVVYVVGAGDEVTARPIEPGPLSGDLRVIISGLKPDDRIVIRGLQRVQVPGKVAPIAGTITRSTSDRR